MAIAGKVAITPGGEWSVDVAYDKLVVVTFGNNVYLSIKPSTGIEPTNEEYWMLLIENVTQEQYDEIINGTTPVGNANAVNGFKVYNTPSQLGLTSNHIPDIVKAMPKTSIFIAAVVSGYSFALASANNNLPHPNGLLHIVKSNESTRTSIMYYGMDSADVFGVWQCDLNMSTSTIDGWVKLNDGGNADTVDGKHASELVNYLGVLTDNTIISNFKYPTPYEAVISSSLDSSIGLPSGFWHVKYFSRAKTAPDGYGMQMFFPLNMRNDKIYFRTSGTDKWDSLRTLVDTADLANYLPLDGSVPMSGNLKTQNGWNRFGGDSAHTAVTAYSTQNDENNFRALRILNTTFESNTENALEFYELINGVGTGRKVLHTGNSQKVVISASAPSDTSALWIDTTNKKVKAYIDGAWTAMA